MSQIVTFYMFANMIGTVLLGTNNPTIISFPEQIQTYTTPASKTDVQIQVTPDLKTLVLTPRKEKFLKRNILAITTNSGNSYAFNMKMDNKPHVKIFIKNGVPLSPVLERIETYSKLSKIEVLQGFNFVEIKNNRNSSANINSASLPPNKALRLPKGSPVFIDGNREVY